MFEKHRLPHLANLFFPLVFFRLMFSSQDRETRAKMLYVVTRVYILQYIPLVTYAAVIAIVKVTTSTG